jgi:hypothetical protein
MYGLPDSFDPSVFVGRRLTAVTFAENVIVLEFDPHLSVSVFASVSYRTATDTELATDTPPVTQTRLVDLVGRVVTSAIARSWRDLVIELERDASITLVDDSETYESFVIGLGDREIIV